MEKAKVEFVALDNSDIITASTGGVTNSFLFTNFYDGQGGNAKLTVNYNNNPEVSTADDFFTATIFYSYQDLVTFLQRDGIFQDPNVVNAHTLIKGKNNELLWDREDVSNILTLFFDPACDSSTSEEFSSFVNGEFEWVAGEGETAGFFRKK